MTHCEKNNGQPELGVMLDCSRGAVPSVRGLKHFLLWCSRMGYQFVGLYVEDTIEVAGEPYFGYKRGRYTAEEIREADAYAHELGMELRPYIQTLAHLNQITDYAAYAPSVDTGDILLAGDAGTMRLLDGLLSAVSQMFVTRKVNIGMDEAHMVGLGRYLDLHGYRDRVSILLEHLDGVLQLCRKHGLQPQMWSDMFFRLLSHGEYYVTEEMEREAKEIPLPDGLSLCYWDYYHTDAAHYTRMIRAHRLLTEEIAFAGGAWKWMGFAPYNRYSIRATDAALAACADQKVGSIVMTMWGDDGGECSMFSVLPVLFLAARRARALYAAGGDADPGAAQMTDGRQPDALYTQEESAAFENLTGLTLEEFLRLDETNPYAKEPDARNNLSKILLYNDPLQGIFDAAAKKEEMHALAGQFAAAHGRLEAAAEKARSSDAGRPFGVLFQTQAALCDLLSVKADFGVRLHTAYHADDREALARLAREDLPAMQEKLAVFYRAFRRQWEQENKPFGFEVHTIRLGGLRQRLEDVTEMLLSYLDGHICRIWELEEETLPPGYCFDDTALCSLEWNRYEKIVTTGRLTW